MNDQLQKALADFLNLLIEGVKTGAGIAQQQLPLVIQEKLHYELISYLFWGSFWLAAIIVLWVAIETARHRLDLTDREKREFKIYGRLWSILGTFVFFIPMYYNLDWALYIYIAPRVYILEWLKGFIK